jgi:hypothetical protein
LTYASLNQDYSPSADHDVNLPKTSVVAGWKRKIFNRSTTKVLTLKATNSTPGDGGTLCVLTPMTWVDIQAKSAAPAANTSWMQSDAGGNWYALPTAAGDFGADFGTVTNVSFKGRREGPDLRVRGYFTMGTRGGGADVALTLPHSFSLATASLTTKPLLGMLTCLNSAILQDGNQSWINYDGSTATKVYFARNESGGTWQKSTGTNTYLASDKNALVEMLLPISTWEIG